VKNVLSAILCLSVILCLNGCKEKGSSDVSRSETKKTETKKQETKKDEYEIKGNVTGGSNGTIFVELDDKFALFSNTGEKLTDFVYEELLANDKNSHNDDSGVIIAKKEGKYGYLNQKGEEIIPCDFEESYPFQGKYVVLKKPCSHNSAYKYDYIVYDHTGKLIYNSHHGGEVSGHLFLTSDANDRSQVINLKTKKVMHQGSMYGFDGEYVKYGKVNKIGYLDTDGNVMIEAQYDYAYNFEDGKVEVGKDGKVMLINEKNEVLEVLGTYELNQPSVSLRPGYHYERYFENDKCGLKYGTEVVIEPKYEYIDKFSNFIVVKSDNVWNLIDMKGNVLSETSYVDYENQLVSQNVLLMQNDSGLYDLYIDDNGEIRRAMIEISNLNGNMYDADKKEFIIFKSADKLIKMVYDSEKDISTLSILNKDV